MSDKRGAAINPVKLRSIIDAIGDNAPRNGKGELLHPYLGWVRRIEKDLELWQAWKDGAF